jgi:UDP:flavonoid glycosyltransferase YjiC (YdhE family)
MKIGFVSMPLSGHLNPMTALARRLQSRGNEVVFFGVPDVEPFARAAGLSTSCHTAKQSIPSVLSTNSIGPWQRCVASRWCGTRVWN